MKLFFPFLHLPDVERAGVKKRKVVLNFFPEGKDFRKRPMKLALELRQFEKPGFYLFRIDISLRQGRAVQFPFQLGNRLAKRDRRLKIRGHILIVSGQQFQMANLFKKSRFLATQNHLRPFVMPPQLLGPAPLRTHGFKLFFFAFSRRNFFDLREVHFKEFPAIRKLSETSPERFLTLGRFLEFFQQSIACCQKIGLVHPVVNQLGLKIRLEQFLLPMLARMDEKGGSQFLDGFLRGQGVIDEQAATPGFRNQLPADDEFFPGTHEKGLNLSPLFPRTDHVRAEPLSHQKVERFQNEAFPSPRFAGENIHARGKFQFHVGYQGEITNMQIFKHNKEYS